jgi:TRAP transporter TAXI family solute receptor
MRSRATFPRGSSTTGFLASTGLVWIGAALGAAALVALAYYFFAEPTVLRLAVGPADSDEAQLAIVLRERMSRARRSMQTTRIEIVKTAGPVESAAALDARQADLAIVRGDAALPKRGATVFVAHKDAALLIAPARARVDSVEKRKGRRVGVFPGDEANIALLRKILAHSGVPASAVTATGMSEAELAVQLGKKSIDAAMIVGPLTAPATTHALSTVAAAARDKLVELKVEGSEPLAAREPGWASVDIGAGAFDGSPPWPAEDTSTAGVLWTLEADHDLSDRVVGNLAQALYARREDIAAEAPIFAFMEKPEAEQTSRHPVHPGAWAYYSDSTKSWSDQYGDFVYMGAMALSAFGSGFAALFGLSGVRSRRRALSLIDDLIDVKGRAHAAADAATLEKLETEVEELSTTGLRHARDGVLDESNISALNLGLAECRRAIDDRRNSLQGVEARPQKPLSLVARPEGAAGA